VIVQSLIQVVFDDELINDAITKDKSKLKFGGRIIVDKFWNFKRV
jgi:hypothetical protein